MVSCEIRIWHHLVQFLNPPQSATSCHREVIPNSCHYPEVAIQLNYNFYIIFTTEARSKAHLGQHCVTWWCLPQAVEPHRAAEPSGCSGCWVTAGLCGVDNPQRALSMSWGSRALLPAPGALQLQVGWDLSPHSCLLCVWNASRDDRNCDSTELSQYPLYTELEFKSWCPQNHSCLQGSSWVPLMPV